MKLCAIFFVVFIFVICISDTQGTSGKWGNKGSGNKGNKGEWGHGGYGGYKGGKWGKGGKGEKGHKGHDSSPESGNGRGGSDSSPEGGNRGNGRGGSDSSPEGGNGGNGRGGSDSSPEGGNGGNGRGGSDSSPEGGNGGNGRGGSSSSSEESDGKDGQCEANGPVCLCVEYKIFLNELSYGDARAACRADNGMLATVDSYYVQNLLETNIENENVGDLVEGFWIGLDDCNMEGTFSWRDGTVLTGNCYQNWFGDHSHNNRDCVAISKSKSYKWDDFACSMEMGYICMYYNCDNRDVQCQQCAELPPEPVPGGGD